MNVAIQINWKHTIVVLSAWLVISASTQAEITYQNSYTLPYSGGVGQITGDIVTNGNGAAAVYSRPDGNFLRLMFYRFGTDGSVELERQVGSDLLLYYEPALCWDGENYAVASSTITQSSFMVLSSSGDEMVPGGQLPGIRLISLFKKEFFGRDGKKINILKI